jgi:predicted O-linked N-acetylglucosamine transferase (SPINDLY family)
LLADGRTDEAIAAYRAALTAAPGEGALAIGLAHALNEAQRPAEAEPVLRDFLRREPANFEALLALSTSLKLLQRFDESWQVLLAAARISPEDANAPGLAARLFAQIGRHAQSVALFNAAIHHAPGDARWQVLRALAMPAIPESTEAIARQREDMARRIAALRESTLTLADPELHIDATGFFLAYHGIDDLPIQRAIAAMYLQLQPALGWVDPEALPRSRAGRKLRIGFLSEFLRLHTIGKLYRGLIAGIDRARFEVVVIHTDARQDALAAEIDGTADRVIVLPPRLGPARRAVSGARLDVLFYPDIGMSPFTYFLAMARLAPVQATTYGHPDTTGLPHMDHFVSAAAIEPEGAEAHYAERLERLSRMPVYYRRPQRTSAVSLRERYRMPADAKMYVCPQTLFKFHPEFDRTLGALLAADPKAQLVLIASVYTAWCNDLMARFARAIPAHLERIRYVPTLPEAEFLELLHEADAVLDPLHFGGGNSTYEAFAVGAPVVTLPGPFMRGRVTLGCYRQMGFEDLVASGPEHYVALAVRLANDTAFRDAMRARVRERSGVLFEDHGVLREFEALFERCHDQALARAAPSRLR